MLCVVWSRQGTSFAKLTQLTGLGGSKLVGVVVYERIWMWAFECPCLCVLCLFGILCISRRQEGSTLSLPLHPPPPLSLVAWLPDSLSQQYAMADVIMARLNKESGRGLTWTWLHQSLHQSPASPSWCRQWRLNLAWLTGHALSSPPLSGWTHYRKQLGSGRDRFRAESGMYVELVFVRHVWRTQTIIKSTWLLDCRLC